MYKVLLCIWSANVVTIEGRASEFESVKHNQHSFLPSNEKIESMPLQDGVTCVDGATLD